MFDWQFAKEALPKIIAVTPMALLITVVATVAGLILAILIVMARERKRPIPVITPLVAGLVSFIRGTPMIVQLYVVYYGLPQLLVAMKAWGFNTNADGLPVLLIAFLAFSFNAAANLSESIRSAYHAVDAGQYEAAVTVGMAPNVAMRRIVVPQLITNLLPNLTNIILDLVKDTALVYNIGIVEIMGEANTVSALGFKYLETYLDALLVYIVICWIIAKIFQLIEYQLRRRYSLLTA